MICVVGPTASGKTSLGVKIAKAVNGEVVSADSMQIYKGMDIATAKPTQEECDGVIHHLIGFLEPDKAFSVAQYVELAHSTISDIISRNKVPVIVGGTGLYVDSLLNNIEFTDEKEDPKLRKELSQLANEKGVDYLLNMLSEFDKVSYENLREQRNIKRIIRAIEVYKLTGITFSEKSEAARKKESPYAPIKIGLTATDREFLYQRINKRVDIMLDMGLVTEAKQVYLNNLSDTSKMAIGYKELKPYLDGDKELCECVEKLKRETRRYAKRQLTWFKRDEKINWFDIDTLSNEELFKNCLELIKSKGFEIYG